MYENDRLLNYNYATYRSVSLHSREIHIHVNVCISDLYCVRVTGLLSVLNKLLSMHTVIATFYGILSL